jgi:hypothetical protein
MDYAASSVDAGSRAVRPSHDEIVATFLSGVRLRRVLSHMCNNASSGIADPVTSTIRVMLACPVQLVISEVGVALFKDHPNVLYPFAKMDVDQRYLVERVVSSCMHLHDICPRLGNRVVVQMGGGCILYTDPPPPSSVSQQETKPNCFVLRPIEVLRALCDCIFASAKYGDPAVRHAIASILLQRIVGAVNIPKDDQRAAFAYAGERLASLQQSLPARVKTEPP